VAYFTESYGPKLRGHVFLALKAGHQYCRMNQNRQLPFFSFLRSKEIRFELYSTILLFLISGGLIFWIYPLPNIYADTGAYISVAGTGEIGNFRPPGFSWLLALAHFINPNADVLVVIQLLLYFFSTLFFYVTVRYFFPAGKQVWWRAFFLIFLFAPVCIYLCNFAISDALFISVTNLWVASLLWMMGSKKASPVIWNGLLLLLVMQVRFIALFYPLVTVVALFLTYFKASKLRFIVLSAIQVALFFGLVYFTTWQTKKNTGVSVLSGFSGWQKANNAMHAVPYINLKPEEIEDSAVRRMHAYILANNPPGFYPAKDSIVIFYLWSPDSPFKKYLNQLRSTGKQRYLHYWHLSSVSFGEWGNYIVKKYPAQYARHYIYPNFLLLFDLPNEALFYFPPYSEQMKKWFQCGQCDPTPRYTFVHSFLEATAPRAFNLLWFLLLFSIVALCFRSKLNCTAQQYNMILLVSFFCIVYTAMSVYASPLVLRYMLAIRHSSLLIPFLVTIHLNTVRKK